jgi:hypothetical protein
MAETCYFEIDLEPFSFQLRGSETCWFNTNFNTFSFNAVSGETYLKFALPVFSFNGEVVSNNLITSFNPFDVNLNVLSGTVSNLSADFSPYIALFSSSSIAVEAAAIKLSSTGVVYQIPTISISVNTITISSDGSVSGSVTVVEPPNSSGDGSDAYTFSGEMYIVLNLKTGAHSEYRDGDNNALATTGELTFSSQHVKNVSDAHILSRADGDLRVIVKSGENIERTHDLTFNVDDAGNLKNKKLALAKGIKSTNWQFSVGSPDGDKLEVRSIDLQVNTLKRRV